MTPPLAPMKLPDKPPDYGVDEPLRATWFAATMPPTNNLDPNFDPFWRGVHSTFEEHVSLTVHIKGVMKQRDFFNTNALIVSIRKPNLDELGKNMVKWINWFIVEFKTPQFPHDWIHGWCKLFVWSLWAKEARARGIILEEEEETVEANAKVRVEEVEKAEEKEPEIEKELTREKAAEKAEITSKEEPLIKSLAKLPPKAIDPATLKFKLFLMTDDKTTEIIHVTISASATLPPGADPAKDTNYSFPFFLKAFEKELNATSEDDTAIWSLVHGKVGYYMGKSLKVIQPPRQQRFEEGINWMLARPRKNEDVVLEFEFTKETSAQKKAREGAAKARARVGTSSAPIIIVSNVETKGKDCEGVKIVYPASSLSPSRLPKSTSPSSTSSSSPQTPPQMPKSGVTTTLSRISPAAATPARKPDIPSRSKSPRLEISRGPATKSPASPPADSARKRSIDRVKAIFTKLASVDVEASRK